MSFRMLRENKISSTRTSDGEGDRTQSVISGYGYRIRRAYIAALCLIGILSVAAYIALNGFIKNQDEYASVINIAGKQRMLSQRIAGLAQSVSSTSDGEQFQRDMTLLAMAVNDMEVAHYGLMNGNISYNLPGMQSPEEESYYLQPPYNINPRVQEYISLARKLLSESGDSARVTLAHQITDIARTDLVRALNAVVIYYEDQVRESTEYAENIHLAILIATLAILLGEALFVFAPLANELIRKEMAVHEKQAELSYTSFHDQLTGLYNRRFLREKVEDLPATNDCHETDLFSLMAIDLDNFKDVNDTSGHESGDRLLCLVADILRKGIRERDLAFRMGGDEFLVWISTVDKEILEDIAERLRGSIQTVLSRERGCSSVSASFGIASAYEQCTSFDDVLSNADIALYNSKSLGKNAITIYSESLRVTFEERRNTEAMIRDALNDSAFIPFFQPQVDMRTGEVIGVEALARCHDKQGNIIPPSEFLAIAEETGLIVQIGAQVITKAIQSGCAWLANGTDFGRLSVNASSVQLHDPGFVEFLSNLLDTTGFPAEQLSIEVLETVLLDDDNFVVEIVEKIRNMGISVELDDFGTGYTSIANVNRLMVDRIKIDRSFIESAGATDKGVQILKAILTMARSLGVDVIAEGIETQEQEKQLIELGCTSGQGYKFARPMCDDELQKYFVSLQGPISQLSLINTNIIPMEGKM